MPLNQYKGKNHRCKRDRFIDSNGVPHDPAERGWVGARRGRNVVAHRVHLGRTEDAEDGAIDYRELGEGAHMVAWDSGIVTIVKLVADPETGRCRVASLDGTEALGQTEGPIGYFYPPTFDKDRATVPQEVFPDRLKARLSRTLRRRVDEVCAARAAKGHQVAAKLRRDSQRVVDKLASQGVVDPEFADVLAQLSEADLNASFGFVTQRDDATDDKQESEVLEQLAAVYTSELEARKREREADDALSEWVWPQVWQATLLGLNDRDICRALKDGENPAELAVAREMARERKEMYSTTEYWPMFSKADIAVLQDAGFKSKFARVWWNAGARDAATVLRLHRGGIGCDQALVYAKAGLDVDEMEMFYRAGLHTPEQIARHIAHQIADHEARQQARASGPLY